MYDPKNTEGKREFRILSIDGGGTRGITAAAFIAEFEKEIEPLRARDYFDLIAGTSTGGIIALCLGLGIPAPKIRDFYKDYSAEIFPPVSGGLINLIRRIFSAKYQQANLIIYIGKLFSESGIADRPLVKEIDKWESDNGHRIRVMVPVFELSPIGRRCRTDADDKPVNYSPKVYYSNYVTDQNIPIEDIISQTTAGPTYFPISGGKFIDGGVSINHPAIAAVAYAVNKSEDRDVTKPTRTYTDVAGSDVYGKFWKGMGKELGELRVLSVGTGTSFLRRIDTDTVGSGNWGIFKWAFQLPEMITETNMAASEYYASKIIPDKRYMRIQHDLSGITGSLARRSPAEIPLDENDPEVIYEMMLKGADNFITEKKYIMDFLSGLNVEEKKLSMMK